MKPDMIIGQEFIDSVACTIFDEEMVFRPKEEVAVKTFVDNRQRSREEASETMKLHQEKNKETYDKKKIRTCQVLDWRPSNDKTSWSRQG